jgi:YesN/AraC family two-component response regulator
MKRILFVDDHTILRQGVINLLKEMLEIPLEFDQASHGEQAATLLKSRRYDLVLLDISLPDKDGLSLLKQWHLQYPKLPFIILSSHPEEQ